MQIYCLSCKKHTDNISSKKVIMTNKVMKPALKCANCVAEKSRFLKQKSKKTGWDKINPCIIKHAVILFEVQKIQKT